MINEQAEKWLVDLESGRYRQGFGRLVEVDIPATKYSIEQMYDKQWVAKNVCFCALGLAERSRGSAIHGYRMVNLDSNEKAVHWLNPSTMSELGLKDDAGHIIVGGNHAIMAHLGLEPGDEDSDELHFSLSMMNDELKMSFVEIAKIMRIFPELFFEN